ncbi:MAG: TIGR00296 family protein [Candidatus Micrarchaeota archaeon]|nr:TIGR00296 family protein [Candidatus Micrarchaeota archaeon]
MHVLAAKEGERLVKAARYAIELFIINPNFEKEVVSSTLEEFGRPYGVFVTLEHYPTRSLRGCIGFPRAIAPLGESLVDAAIAAAFEDPRFVSVSKKELDDLLVEVSVLSSPVLITGGERKRLDSVKVGRDGLMVEYGMQSGLLLPIVAVEQGWDRKRFLEETCVKAGMHRNYWSQPKLKLYKFETQLFREEKPGGKVLEVKYDKD